MVQSFGSLSLKSTRLLFYSLLIGWLVVSFLVCFWERERERTQACVCACVCACACACVCVCVCTWILFVSLCRICLSNGSICIMTLNIEKSKPCLVALYCEQKNHEPTKYGLVVSIDSILIFFMPFSYRGVY